MTETDANHFDITCTFPNIGLFEVQGMVADEPVRGLPALITVTAE